MPALAAVCGAGAALAGRTWAETLAFAILGLAAAFLVVIDFAEYRLPDAIVLPTYPLFFGALTLAAALENDWSRLGRAAAAGGLLLVSYFILAWINPAGLGLGDVKLAGLLGGFLGWFGWPQVLMGTLAAFALVAVVSLILLALRRVGRKSEIPFGPWMIAGAAVGAAWQPLVLG
ncbi:prepilin peptidase [Georgenia muralis]|uniref:prepilin peptidase n=1 Tax=Georgenia muralis TaxID=154117 RepID=UPI001FEA2CF5|nr:A24 family peptidase [Georgenia muralis]